MKGFHPPQSEMKKHNDLSKTKETLHVAESMEKVERFWYMRNIHIKN